MFFWLNEKTLSNLNLSALLNIQGEAHKLLQSDITQAIDHIQKCFRQKF